MEKVIHGIEITLNQMIISNKDLLKYGVRIETMERRHILIRNRNEDDDEVLKIEKGNLQIVTSAKNKPRERK